MTPTAVFLVVLGSIAACFTLIFAVETLVAFGLHRKEAVHKVLPRLVMIDGAAKRERDTPQQRDRAA